jgi:hypothetical protein
MRISGRLALFLLVCAGLGAQTEGFGGVTVNSLTGQPLGGVHVKLFTLNVGGAMPDAYGALSGPDGRFSVTGIPPGTYLLLVERTGFVNMMASQGAIPLPSVTFHAGQSITDYKLEMTPRAVIAGRVLDEYGDPAPNVRVEATPVKPEGPKAASLGGGNAMVTTNMRGEFRISGGPGEFYVKATPPASNQAPEIRTDGTSHAAYGPTWYPAATSLDRASAVEAEAGGDATVEIRLTRQRSITISGSVSGIPPGSSALVTLYSGDRPTAMNLYRTRNVGPDDKFAIPDLPLAYYRVQASLLGGSANMRSQSVDVGPDAPEAVEVQLALGAGVEVTGTLEIAGDPPGTPVEKRTVTVGSFTATSDPDGAFKIAGVFPGRFAVDVQPLPDNGYVKAVELDGVTVSAGEVDFSHVVQGSRLRITLARDGGQLSGTVLDKDGQPLGHTVAIVVLAPDAEHIATNPNGLVKEGGKYSLTGIRPGKYLLFAIDAFRSGPSNSADDLKRMAAAAEEIEIKAGDRIAKDLKVLLKEDVDARSKK